MYNVMIVEDEDLIRQRIRAMLDWNALGLAVSCEARDGKEALDMAALHRPHVVFTDIRLPFLNGLDLVEQLSRHNPQTLSIVIAGHDAFDYPLKAIQIKAFDFLLKPVRKDQLNRAALKAVRELDARAEQERYVNWAKRMIKNDFMRVKERFLNDWINGSISHAEFLQQKDLLGIHLPSAAALFLLNPLETFDPEAPTFQMKRQRRLHAVQRVMDKYLASLPHGIAFISDDHLLAAIIPETRVAQLHEIHKDLRRALRESLGVQTVIISKSLEDDYESIPVVYNELLSKINAECECAPLAKRLREYILENFHDSSLSADDVCSAFKISRTHAWKLLKAEYNISFSDILNDIRIERAIELMRDPVIKLYEVAEKVGFNSQHYFSIAFKKKKGISPEAFRSGAGEAPEPVRLE